MRLVPSVLLLLWVGCGDDVPPDTGPKVVDTGERVKDSEPTEFEVIGTVVDAAGVPIEAATVLVGGKDETMVLTDADGAFSVWYTDTDLGQPAIVAGKQGYRAIGHEFLKIGAVEIFLLGVLK